MLKVHVKFDEVVIKNENALFTHYWHHTALFINIKSLFELLYITVQKQNMVLYLTASKEDGIKHLISMVHSTTTGEVVFDL